MQQKLLYILAYKSKNIGQFFALRVGGLTYMRVSKFATSHRCGNKPSELYRQWSVARCRYCCTADGVLMTCKSCDRVRVVDLYMGLEFWTFFQSQSQGSTYMWIALYAGIYCNIIVLQFSIQLKNLTDDLTSFDMIHGKSYSLHSCPNRPFLA